MNIDNIEIFQTVLNLYQKQDWRGILDLNKNSDNKNLLKLCWVWPSEDNLYFIKHIMQELELCGLISIGCGCGLLEWILLKYLDLPVKGLEVNKEWWQSKYSNPQFITLDFVENKSNIFSDSLIFDSNHVLLFCYFNNGNAFREYVKLYSGDVIIIIGPGNNAGRHTDPLPFSPNFENNSEWKIHKSQEIKNTKDYIVFYVRSRPI